MSASIRKGVASVTSSIHSPRGLAAAVTIAIVLLAFGRPGIRANACETLEWDGGKMTKWVNPDVENNKVTITVDYTKKTSEAGKQIRFIEMIGPKGWPYNDRILIGGGHKKIPAGDASGKVVWEVTKANIPNMRQGTIGGCSSCHDEANMPALDEWPDDPRFSPVTDAEFKNWVQGMRDNGYEQYIDINPQDPGDENTDTSFKTRCFQTAVRAQPELPNDFYFYHYNRGLPGFYTLQIEELVLPPGWEVFTIPPLGMPYFLNSEQGLSGQVTIIPHGVVTQGDEARVTIAADDQDSGERPETFSVRSVKDDLAPLVTDGPHAVLTPSATILASVTATDLPATMASAKLFYFLNGAPEASGFMDIASSTTDPVLFEREVDGLVPGPNQFDYFVRLMDEVGNVVDTPLQNESFNLPNCTATVAPYNSSSPPNVDVLTSTPAVIGSTWSAEVTHAAGTATFSTLLVRGSKIPGNGAPAGSKGRLLVSGAFFSDVLGAVDTTPPILASQKNFSAAIPLQFSLACIDWFGQAITGGSGQQKLSNGIDGDTGTQ